MSFLDDYLFYNSGNECPPEYHRWSTLCLLSSVIGRRVFFAMGDVDGYGELRLAANIYVCLVGYQGSRKSFGKDVVRNIVSEKFPEIPMSASVDTREAITKFLGSDDALRVYLDETGQPVEYRPMFIVVNELVNFLSVNPMGMINMLVDIYDRPFFDVRTKNQGTDIIANPYIVILACATTEFIVDQLRTKILSGGLARRMVFVNMLKENVRKANPKIPPGGREALERAILHLHSMRSCVGQMTWDSESTANYYDLWYSTLKLPSDPLMAGFYRSKHIQVIKLSMLYSLAEYPPSMKISKVNLQKAIATVDLVEPGMEALFLSAGRNELIVPQQRILSMLEAEDGWLPEKMLQRNMDKDLTPMEQMSLVRHLLDTDRIVRRSHLYKGVERVMLVLPWKIKKLEENGEPPK